MAETTAVAHKGLREPKRSAFEQRIRAGFKKIWDWFGGGVNRLRGQWRSSLQFRAVLASVVLSAIAFLGVGSFLSNQIANALYQERVNTFSGESRTELSNMQGFFGSIADQDRDSVQNTVISQLRKLERSGAEISRKYMLVPLGSGPSFWVYQQSSAGLVPSQIPPDLAAAVNEGDEQYFEPLQITSQGRNVPAIAYGTKVTMPPNAPYALYLIYDLGPVQQTLDNIHRVLYVAGLILLVVIGFIAWLVTRAVVRPVSSAAQVSERLAAGQLQERMKVQGEDEIARLATSFNHMAASLQEQINKLATLSKMQQRFVSDVSHELRTPLTTVRMAAEVLYNARYEFDPINQRSTELLHDQVERFEGLLADLLEVSRFDAGVAVLEPEQTNMYSIVSDVVQATEPLAKSHKAKVTIHSDSTAIMAEVDPRRIERIIRNLVVNGLEHGEGKPLDIYLGHNEQAVAVAVRDHGVGMSELEATRVFDRFWRADPARARTSGGSGLGLSIASEDTRLHHGWLQAWGEPGQGACFRVTLPVKPGVPLTGSPLALPPDLTLSAKKGLTP